MEEEKKEGKKTEGKDSLRGSIDYLMKRCVKNEDSKTVKNRLRGNALFLGVGVILIAVFILFF